MKKPSPTVGAQMCVCLLECMNTHVRLSPGPCPAPQTRTRKELGAEGRPLPRPIPLLPFCALISIQSACPAASCAKVPAPMWWAVGGPEAQSLPGQEEKGRQMAEMAGEGLRATCKGGGGKPALVSLSPAPALHPKSPEFTSWPRYLLTVTLVTVLTSRPQGVAEDGGVPEGQEPGQVAAEAPGTTAMRGRAKATWGRERRAMPGRGRQSTCSCGWRKTRAGGALAW